MFTSVLACKFVSIIAKDMVNFDVAKRFSTELYRTSRHFISRLQQDGLQISEENPNEQQSLVSTEYLVYNWLEALFAWFQMVILWHDPFVSICAISGLIPSFLLIIYLAPNFYATICIVLFIYTLTTVWFRYIWPEIRVTPEASVDEESRLDVDRWTHLHPQLLTLNELSNLIRNLLHIGKANIEQLLELRRNRPGIFCLKICLTLSCTAYIGNQFSDFTFIFCILLAVVTIPGIYLYLLPQTSRDYMRNQIDLFLRQQPKLDSQKLIDSDEHKATTSTFSTASLLELLRCKGFLSLPDKTQSSQMSGVEVEKENLIDNKQFKEDDPKFPDTIISAHNPNESTDLIDLEDEQHDGFVLL